MRFANQNSMNKIKNVLSIAFFSFNCISFASVASPVISGQSNQIEKKSIILNVLNKFTFDNTSFYQKVISPAKILDIEKPDNIRISEINTKIATEMDLVLTAFETAEGDKKQAAVVDTLKKFDSQITESNTTHIEFTGKQPSSAIGRVVLVSRKKPETTLNQIMNIITSFKRSAKKLDFVYEYSDSRNLSGSTIIETIGDDNTWKKENAPKEFEFGNDYALKKCRQILSWKCITTLYNANQISDHGFTLNYLYMGNYNLSNNSDNSYFNSDERTKNQVSGSTALYIVSESADWFIIYGIDISISKGKNSFTDIIQKEFSKDFKRLNQRLQTELNL